MEVPMNVSDAIQAAQAIVPRLEASSRRSEQLRRLDDDAVAAMNEDAGTGIGLAICKNI
jgi:hypothetical protein